MGAVCNVRNYLGEDTPPPGFWQKRLQAIENKGDDTQKERQEAARLSA
jgi:hypothetical protein